MLQRLLFTFALSLSCACSGGEAGPGDAGAADAGAADAGAADAGPSLPREIGPDERPARVVFPTAYDGETALPLVVLLHGYSASATLQDVYWGMSRHARANGYYLVLPDGTVDESGNRFWNATPACCDFGGTGVDDEAYLRGLVHEMKDRFPVDAGRVYFVGHSNGGFMSFRMACAMADEVTAIGGLAGATFLTEEECGASQPVSVLQVHGTLDDAVAYEGGPAYPSAPEAVRRWAERAGCDTSMPSELEPMDLESDLPGAETTVLRYETGCVEGVDAELWTIEGGSHIPVFHDDWPERLTGWLFRHAR